ncbi:MAG: sulfur carrier protein ThiS [bacterium]|nr:sulfur carrier protein ThiS [bacterium]
MKVVVNNQEKIIIEKANLIDLLLSLSLPSLEFGVAVALNGNIIDKSKWQDTELKEKDSIEVVRAFQGG